MSEVPGTTTTASPLLPKQSASCPTLDTLASFALPRGQSPGSEVLSKIMLKDPRIMDIILKSVIDSEATSSTFRIGTADWMNNLKSSVVYLPHHDSSMDHPPVLVQVQDTLDADFFSMAIRHCISIYEEHKKLPILLMICVRGFSSDDVKVRFKLNDGRFLAETECEFWAKRCLVLSPEFFHNYINEDPMNELVALGYFMSEQKRSILSLEKKEEPTVRLLYEIAKSTLRSEDQEELQLDVIYDLCYKATTQFQSILDCIEQDEATSEYLRKLVKDGVEYFSWQEKMWGRRLQAAGSMLQDSSLDSGVASGNQQLQSDDFMFVDQYIQQCTGRMHWKQCYLDGREKGLFKRYVGATTLKSAYHNMKSKDRKRKRAGIGE